MRTAPILTVDVGTSSLRAILFASDGRVLRSAQEHYRYREPMPGHMEQDPGLLLAALGRAVRACVSSRSSPLSAVCISTYLHSLLLVDRRGEPLSPLMLWGDTRAAREAEELRRGVSGRMLSRTTGCPPHSSYPLSKILWLSRHHPRRLARARAFLSAKSYLLAKLVGRAVEDEAVASASGLWDLAQRRWSRSALDLAGIDETRLPEVAAPTAIVGGIARGAAAALHLPLGTPVIAGAGDGMLANLGAGAVAPGDMCITIGTSAALRLVRNRPQGDPSGRLFCYAFDGRRFIVGGASNAGGHALAWCRETFGDGYGSLYARPAPVLFFPFFHGERAPDWDARLSGALVGFRHELSPRTIYEALASGIACNLRRIFDLLEERCGRARRIILSGGAFRSRLLAQTLADVLGRSLEMPRDLEASSAGAYRLACDALSLPPTIRMKQTRVRPDKARHRAYEPIHDAYVSGVRALKPLWRRLAEIPAATAASLPRSRAGSRRR